MDGWTFTCECLGSAIAMHGPREPQDLDAAPSLTTAVHSPVAVLVFFRHRTRQRTHIHVTDGRRQEWTTITPSDSSRRQVRQSACHAGVQHQQEEAQRPASHSISLLQPGTSRHTNEDGAHYVLHRVTKHHCLCVQYGRWQRDLLRRRGIWRRSMVSGRKGRCAQSHMCLPDAPL